MSLGEIWPAGRMLLSGMVAAARVMPRSATQLPEAWGLGREKSCRAMQEGDKLNLSGELWSVYVPEKVEPGQCREPASRSVPR